MSRAYGAIRIPSIDRCFRTFYQPLKGAMSGAYGETFSGAKLVDVDDDLATAHLATVGGASIPVDLVNGLMSDVPANRLPESVVAAIYDPEHRVAAAYLAGGDDNTMWLVRADSQPREIAVHRLTWLRSPRLHIGIGSSRQDVERAFGTLKGNQCNELTALTYYSGTSPEGRYGYIFIIQNDRVIAVRSSLGL